MVDNQLPLLNILRITLLLELTLAFITPIIIPNDHTHNNNYNNNKFFKKKTFVLKNATPSPDIAATATTAKAKTNSKKYNQQLGEFERLNIITKTDNGGVGETTMNSRIVKLHDFSSLDPIHYQTMWDIQKEIVDGHVERLKVEFKKEEPKSQFWLKEDIVINDDTDTDTDTDTNSNDIEDQSQDQQMQQQQQFVNKNHRKKGCDTVIILQHEPVYTLGTASDTNFIKSVGDGIDVIRIERGGEVTYHGPGQLTVYPILDLRGYKQDIHWYMRALEEAILLALHRAGVSEAVQEDDVTGVWVNGKKIAALGVKVRRWVTMHGLAVNVDKRSIENFNGIVPCGLEGREVCCINDFLDEPISMEDFAEHLKVALEDIFEVEIL